MVIAFAIVFGFVAGFALSFRVQKHAARPPSVGRRLAMGVLGASVACLAATTMPDLIMSAQPWRWSVAVQKLRTPEEFDAFVRVGDTPVLVGFYAKYSAHGRNLVPLLNVLADEGFPIAVVDTDTYADLARPFNIEILPTSVVFRQGAESARFPGVVPLEDQRAALTAAISSDPSDLSDL